MNHLIDGDNGQKSFSPLSPDLEEEISKEQDEDLYMEDQREKEENENIDNKRNVDDTVKRRNVLRSRFLKDD